MPKRGGQPANRNRAIEDTDTTPQTHRYTQTDLDNIATIAEYFDETKIGAIRKALQLLADECRKGRIGL